MKKINITDLIFAVLFFSVTFYYFYDKMERKRIEDAKNRREIRHLDYLIDYFETTKPIK